MVKQFIEDKNTLNKLYQFIKIHGRNYGAGNFYIDEEWEPVLYMTKQLINKGEDINLTYPTRLYNLLEEFIRVLKDNDKELEYNEAIEYAAIALQLQKYQIEHCDEKDKWYFKNLGFNII